MSTYRDKKLGYILLLPSILLILAVSCFPLINGIWMSFTDYNLLNPRASVFVGLNNFTRLFGDRRFFSSLNFTFIYTFSVALGSYIIGLGIALIMNQKIHCRGLARALILAPWVVSPAVAAICWRWILLSDGIINQILIGTGILDTPMPWLGLVRPAQVIVVLSTIWRQFPFCALVLLAGLQSIDNDLYEAARIDGAGAFKSFIYITMPSILQVSVICTVLQFIWQFNNFESIFLLTQGGPMNSTIVLSVLTYNNAFNRFEFGYAAAIGVVTLLGLTLFTLVYRRLLEGSQDHL